MLDERSIGIIYTIKRSMEDDYEENIIQYMMKHTLSPREAYSHRIVTNIVEQAFQDMADNVKFASSLISDYFYYLRRDNDHFRAMCLALTFVRVKDYNRDTASYDYVNGFWEIKDDND